MKKAIHLVLISLFLTVSGLAQAQLHKDCSAEVYNDLLMQNDLQFARNQKQIEAFTRNFVQNGTSNLRSSGPVTIPVVVHVVYNTAIQNISDAQILSQIDALNEDFRKLNADTINIPNAFKSLTGNMQIEFCLAKRDPSGNPTTGITRTSTSEISFSSDNKVKFNSTGGKDIWDRNQYLNIWVCFLGGNLGGYAQYPGGAASTDGVVVTYTTFGRTSNVAAPYNLGRVTTHEVGHWLNLRHIWGSSACGDDFVADTPQQDGNNFFCPTYPKLSSCSGSNSNGDMFMNHMDYTYDGCKNMFTVGQVARAQALFAPGGSREPLLNSLGCVPVGSSSCSVPTGITSTAVTDNAAMISWNSTNATSYSLRYRALGSTTWITANTVGTSIQLTSLTGLTTYEYQLQSVCSSTSSNFSPSSTFTTLQLCPLPTNLSSSAITTTGATLNWSSTGASSYNIRYRVVGNSTWTNTTSTTNSKVLTGLASQTNYEYQVLSVCSTVNSAFTASQNFTTLIFCAVPSAITISNIQNTMATVTWTGSGASAYNIRFKPASSSTWTTYSTTNTSQTLVNLIAGTTYNVEVQAVCSGTPSAFSSTTNFTTTGGTSSCNVPAGLAANSITSSSAILSWTSTAASSYGVRYKLTSSTVWTNTSSGTNSLSLGGLVASSNYEFQVYSICGSVNSAYSGSSTFTTSSNCNVVTGLSSSSVTSSTATLTWSSSGANSYNVQYRITGSGTWINTSSSTASVSISALTASSTYEFQVASVCGSTTSAFSSSANFTTLTNCNIPAGLNASSITASTSVLSWVSTGAASYNVRYRTSGSSTWTNTSSTSNSVTISGLTGSTAYEFQVSSVCGSTSSAYSGSYTFITLVSCNIPAGLTSSSVTSNSAVISWTSTSASSYNVRFRQTGTSTWTNTSTSAISMTLSGLASGINYEFQVSSVCGSTSSAYSSSASFATLISCSIPTGLSASSISTSGVTLNWTSTGANSYNIRYRALGSSTWINGSSNTTSIGLGGLAQSTNYEYQVASVCGTTTSNFSGSGTFTTLALCSAPSGLSASGVSTSTATLNWASNGANSYSIRYKLTSSSVWTNVTSTSNSIAIQGLISGSVYEFQVSSVCGSTTSSYSSSATFTTLLTCNIPSGLMASSIGTSSVVVSWGTTGAGSYNIRYRISGNTTWTTVTSTLNSIQLTGLSASSTYEYQVNSVCGSSSSSYSALANFTTTGVCSSPTGYVATILNSTSALISWDNNGSVSYRLRYRLVGTTSWVYHLTANTSYQLNGLTPSSDYEIQLRSECTSTNSSYSIIYYFSTYNNCGVPNGLSAISTGTTSGMISWNSNSAPMYEVDHKLVSSTIWSTISTNSNTLNLSGLNVGQSYQVRVRAVCGAVNSDYSTIETFTTDNTCVTPSGLSVGSITTNTAIVSWQSTSAVSYTIRYRVSGTSTWTAISTTATTRTLSGLTAGTSYDVQIMAVCGSIQSVYSSSVVFSTLVLCNTPVALSIDNVDANSISVSWNTSAHSSFNIRYRATGSTTWTLVQGILVSPYSIQGLNPVSSYEIQIQGVCLDGSSNFSASVSATTSTVVVPCSSDIYEPNDSKIAAKRINPDTNYNGLICDSNDQDWFEFKITNVFNNVRVDLSSLPADYDLELFDSNLNSIATSTSRGTLDEMLVANSLSKGGTYFIKISGYNGATHPSMSYTLLFSKSRTAYSPSGNLTIPDPDPSRAISVYPNPTLGDFNLTIGTELEGQDLNVRIMDQTGKVHFENNFGQKLNGFNINIERGNLPAGLYFIEVRTSSFKTIEKLIIY